MRKRYIPVLDIEIDKKMQSAINERTEQITTRAIYERNSIRYIVEACYLLGITDGVNTYKAIQKQKKKSGA